MHDGKQMGWIWVRQRAADDPMRGYGFTGGEYETVKTELWELPPGLLDEK